MRLRRLKNSKEIVASYPDICLISPEVNCGKWREFFKNDNPIYVEVGMGKGKFIYTLAKQNPNINFIGIEKESTVIIVAIKKIAEEKLSNLVLINYDAVNILNIFSENEIDKLYLNFSDPWPKSRHSKRRLTYPGFLKNYNVILNETGDIEFKTDNRKLFEYTVMSFNEVGMSLIDLNLDLHADNQEVVTTEYEDKFVAKGQTIYFLKAKFNEENNE